jgi:membrane fusion protein, copper/silver efflux system
MNMKTARLLLLILLAAAGFVAGYGYGRWYGPKLGGTAAKPQKAVKYHCPMHPNYISDRPGDCPICGMRLVPMDQPPAPAAPEPTQEAPSSLPPGTFHVSTEHQQLIGVRYGEVEMAAASRTIRAVGKVEMDETRIARIHPKVDGWIENVFADFTGKFVKKGQPLLSIYSPELLATQQEYLLAMRAKEILRHSSMSSVHEDNVSLVDAAKRRLELWDLTDEQIEEVQRSGKPLKAVMLFSPISGYITARNAYPKQRVMPDTELYTVVDLSRVWVMADVYEYEAPSVRVGQSAVVTLSYQQGRTYRARVSYIQPSLDPATRTLKVRLELGNPALALKPEMYVDVEFQLSNPVRPMVPADAVLNSGLTKTVFVDHGDGHLEPRHVETGERFGDRLEILKGLSAGERIVVSGTFLIDSESQLKSAAAGMAGHQHGAAPAAPAPLNAPAPAAHGGEHQHD